MMSLKKNTLFNYIGRSYVCLLGIIIVPSYLHYLGAEAFGLIGFFAVMQSWLRILDLGLMPTLSREVAFYRNQENGVMNIRMLLRCLEIIFAVLNLIMILCIVFKSTWITHRWLNVEKLSDTEVSSCISIMGAIIALHWIADLYRAVISGMEKQVWLNYTNIFIVTLQYGGGFILLSCITAMPIHFFEYQLVIGLLELILLGKYCYQLIYTQRISFWNCKISWQFIWKILPFATGIAYSGIIWTLLVESNKLVLSHILPLSTYGYFALVVMISNGIMVLSTPISDAILPRMTNLLSQDNRKEMLRIYKNATQLMAVTMFGLNGILAIFSTQLIYAWTSNQSAAEWAGPVLFWYALGNGFLSVSAFQYYLQYAFGELRLHVIINTIMVIITLPMIVYSAYHWSAIGTGIVWFLSQSLGFFVVTPIIHRKYMPGIHRDWLLKDIFPIAVVISIMLLFIKKISAHFPIHNGAEIFFIVIVYAAIVLITGMVSSSACRKIFGTFFHLA